MLKTLTVQKQRMKGEDLGLWDNYREEDPYHLNL